MLVKQMQSGRYAVRKCGSKMARQQTSHEGEHRAHLRISDA